MYVTFLVNGNSLLVIYLNSATITLAHSTVSVSDLGFYVFFVHPAYLFDKAVSDMKFYDIYIKGTVRKYIVS